MKKIKENINAIVELCSTYEVDRLSVFGSILTSEFSVDSDIDFAVEFAEIDPLDYFDNYYGLKFSLEDLLQRKVDLIEYHAIDNPVFKEGLEKTKELIYDRSSKEFSI